MANARAPAAPQRGRLARASWALAGFAAMGVGMIGLVVPGLPSTGFFVLAAWCFARSSPRLERWFLGLPVIGGLVRNYRDGLGMPRAAKCMAVATMWTAIVISGYVLRERPVLVGIVAALGVVGSVVVLWHVPTKERVLAGRAAAS